MRFSVASIITILALVAGACGSRGDAKEYQLQGQILDVAADHQQATVKHGDIKGFMPAMTMPYKVKDSKQLDGIAAGDLIDATLVVVSNDAYLKDVKKTGQAPLEQPAVDVQKTFSGADLLKEGQSVPNTAFLDQDGKPRDLRSFTGSALVLTFIYTKCPMPTFCPLMDRNFVELQQKVKDDPALNVHLLTVTFDPDTDTPSVLKAHAKKLGADPKVWTFLTGKREDIATFATKFGVSVMRAMNDQRDITHNLRTAIIDRSGNMVKMYTGNEWTPGEVIADIKVLVGVD